MCFVRKLLDYVFSRHELRWLDDILPESHKKEKEDKRKKKDDEKVRSSLPSLTLRPCNCARAWLPF